MSATYDRASAIKAFDESKSGVKGLVDAGVDELPAFFVAPPTQVDPKSTSNHQIPIVDLKDVQADESRRKQAVEELMHAATTYGFFQVVNHGIAADVLDSMLRGVTQFHEGPIEVKKQYYTRDLRKKVRFNSNFDLYVSRVANWRDTLSCTMAPEPPQSEELPDACRDIIFQFVNQIQSLGTLLLELLSEALGLHSDHLIQMECDKGLLVLGHYYPPCPQPDLTLGVSKHSDPGFITILLQDQIGGLQVMHQNQWLDVPPSTGALVVNIGDLLQLITNDKFRSADHRVLIKKGGPRTSVACFFITTQVWSSTQLYGPIKELLSIETPPLYREVTVRDYYTYNYNKGIDGRSALDSYKL
ncbi:1-aminocyclopropane-1-carboxylate oxidase homolog 1-like [Zingiber officinale]|uniref:Fe2OG dioxygenase domain-containing protein n=1 Tax=Zingiber officinale TaxID=94328 RepID=A0A8J5L608_ZINOF|nr:1-aminocyclopropane-1-carboxylate oxidase homolog 1-like [Zingiber officinale]KAG6513735.1 hypothetical protein ZIOFF_024071 [Zingiber officinale]